MSACEYIFYFSYLGLTFWKLTLVLSQTCLAFFRMSYPFFLLFDFLFYISMLNVLILKFLCHLLYEV